MLFRKYIPAYLILLFLLSVLLPLFAQDGSGTVSEPAQDEFIDFDDAEFSDRVAVEEGDFEDPDHGSNYRGLKFAIGALIFTVLAALFLRYTTLRHFRPFFLLASLLVLGFYNGGCPCMISSFQNMWLWLLGTHEHWHKMIWFLGLIPITYLFGRVWCGWVCHLGALQEFIYRPNHLAFLKSPLVQKIFKAVIYVVFILLMVQLFWTKSNIFIHYDPFKVAFNFLSANTLGWILLGLLLISSLLIYRPFCRGFCPIALVLGWVNRIPGSMKLSVKENCSACQRCVRNCPTCSISESVEIDHNECIMCGNCLDECRKEAIKSSRKG
jgi:polyferredoxin